MVLQTLRPEILVFITVLGVSAVISQPGVELGQEVSVGRALSRRAVDPEEGGEVSGLNVGPT